MKKIFLLLMFISVTMICSCGKQDSSAEQQLALRKAELDAREQSLDERVNELNERVNALDDRVNALADAEKERMNARAVPPGVQGQISDVKDETDPTIQQPAVDEQSRVPDLSQLAAEMAEKVRRTQERQLAVDEQSRVLDPSQLAAEMAEKVRRTQEQQRK